jgi:hypothetical protein
MVEIAKHVDRLWCDNDRWMIETSGELRGGGKK